MSRFAGRRAVSMWSVFRPWRENRTTVAGFVADAARWGFDGVELLDLFLRPTAYPNWADRPPVPLDEVRAALDAAGLPCPIYSTSNDFAGDYDFALGRVRDALADAAALGARTLRVFAGDVREGVSFEDARAAIVRGLRESVALGADRGITLALENHGRLAGRPEQVSGLLDDVPGLTANPDTANFLLVDAVPADALRLLLPRAGMVHLKDFAREPGEFTSEGGTPYRAVALGEGAADLPACLDLLAGADVWISLEYEGAEEPSAAIPRSFGRIR